MLLLESITDYEHRSTRDGRVTFSLLWVSEAHDNSCDNDGCEARTFTERIPAFIQHYARRTHRLAMKQQSVAIDAGGAIGQRVLTILDMPVNSDTLIRFIRNAPEPDVATPRILGVDEWVRFVPSKQAIAWG